jgi:hypothetical protein
LRPPSKLSIRPVANAAHAASSSARAREERGRARGGAARAMRRGRVCQARRGGGVAAQPARPRAVQRALGTKRRLGRARRRKQQRRRGRGRPREAHAAAHIIRIVPVDVPSTLDQPPELRLVAVLCGLPQFLVLLGLGGTEPAHVFCAVSAAREGRPTSSLTRNRSEIVRPPSPQRCEACHAPRGHFDSRANSMLDEGCLPAGLPSWPQGPARTPDEGQR